MPRKSFSGQGTIEYLVVLAVVVVISLIVVGLFTGVFSNSSQQILDSSSKLGEVSSGGISIVESVVDIDGNSLVDVANNSGDFIYLTKITLCDGVVNNYGEIGEQIVNGDSKLFSLSSSSCVGGSKSCEIKIEYTTRDGLSKSDSKEVTVTCVGSSTPNSGGGRRGPVNPIPPIIELGTLEQPWIINNCLELQDMNQHLDGNYVLGNNINCYNDTREGGILYNDGAGFKPVGSSVQRFVGTFDGRRYTISNLYINRPNENYVGLFGAITNSNISFVNLVDQNINGNSYVGSIVGDMENSVLFNSASNGHVRGFDTVGGLVGTNSYDNSSIISNSYNLSSVFGKYVVGGIVGNNAWGVVLNCYNRGAISAEVYNSMTLVGGLVGFNMGIVNNVYNTGEINGEADYIGGLIGEDLGLTSNSFNVGLVSDEGYYYGSLIGAVLDYNPLNCYWDSNLSAESRCYCKEYVSCNAPYAGCYSTNGNGSDYFGQEGIPFLLLNWDSNWIAQSNNYPKLYWE